MKIVFIGGRDMNALGGIENYMRNLSTQLVKMHHDPIVFCESDHNDDEYVDGVRVISMKGLSSPLLCKPWVGLKATLFTVFKIRGVDFIHYNAWPPSLWSPIASMFGIDSLMQSHGLEWQRSKYSKNARRILKLMEKITAHTNRHLIMCSDDQTRYFKERYGRNATTVPTAVNLPDLSIVPKSDVLERFKLNSGRYFLLMARLSKEKNAHTLISAFKKAGLDGYKLVIAGDNHMDQEYIDKLHDMARDNENIVFTGPLFGDDKDMILRNALCFCIPSTIEGLSIALLEAMSYKLPVIASNIPSNREVLGPKDAVWVRAENVKDLSKALVYVDENATKMTPILERNYNRIAEHYTWDKVAAKYVDVLRAFKKK